jgi:hypothetical protein
MASPQPNDDPRLSNYSKEEGGSSRDESPARLAADAAMAEKAGSASSGPSPVVGPVVAAAAAPAGDPVVPLEKQPSREVLERSVLKTATLMFALCVSAGFQ